MSDLEFRVAIRDALAEELDRDPSVVFFGEDVAVAGGVFKATPSSSSASAPTVSLTPRSPSSPSREPPTAPP